jgi:quercetin dioxygenase-like cupin family protein
MIPETIITKGRHSMAFTHWADLTAREMVPGFHGKFVHTDNLTVSRWRIEAGATLPEHAHPHEQITMVLEGQLELTVGGETRVLEPGAVAVIPGHVRHRGQALTVCHVIDVFYPARDDYR